MGKYVNHVQYISTPGFSPAEAGTGRDRASRPRLTGQEDGEPDYCLIAKGEHK